MAGQLPVAMATTQIKVIVLGVQLFVLLCDFRCPLSFGVLAEICAYAVQGRVSVGQMFEEIWL